MAKFSFAYEVLKKFRLDRLNVARKEMLAVENKLGDMVKSHRDAIRSRGDLVAEQHRSISDGRRLGLLASLVESQTLKIRGLEHDMQAVEAELERHKSWVTHLGRELKIVEKLEEKQREAFDSEERVREKRREDAWVAERWTATVNGSFLGQEDA